MGAAFPSLANQVTAKTFAETDFYTWNSCAPRIGMTFDLTGDGKTVLKGNYGLYWHNPGVGVGGSGNPNTAGKSATYSWNDINGDRRWQPGEEGAQTVGVARGRDRRRSRTSRRPYTHEASAWVERQLTDTMGIRAGFVYKTEDDLIATYQPVRGLEAFTVPYTFTDIGVDGRAGTARRSHADVLRHAERQRRQLPEHARSCMNVDQYSRYKTFEVSMNKRYGNRGRASMGYGYTHDDGLPERSGRATRTTPALEDRTMWNFKASGSYDAAWGIRISPVLRHQSGSNYARTLTITAPAALGLTATSSGNGGTAYAEPMDANREDNIWVFDVRAEKSFTFTSRMRLRAVLRRVQPDQQPRVGDDQPRDRAELPEAVGHSRPEHGARRLPLHLLGYLRSPYAPGFKLDSCGGVVRGGGATPAPPPFFSLTGTNPG